MTPHLYPPGEPECLLCGAFGPIDDGEPCVADDTLVQVSGATLRHDIATAMEIAAAAEREACAQAIARFRLCSGDTCVDGECLPLLAAAIRARGTP